VLESVEGGGTLQSTIRIWDDYARMVFGLRRCSMGELFEWIFELG
jgi:hypothetical protein